MLQNGYWRCVAVQVVSKPEIYHGIGFKLRADARVLVQRPLRICLGCNSKSKKCDKQLTFIVRVSDSGFIKILHSYFIFPKISFAS